MEIFIGFLCAVLLTVLLVQIGKARELATTVRADKNEEYEVNKLQAGIGVLFVLLFLAACVVSFIYYTPYILGWGVNTAASEHGPSIDSLFNVTLFITSIVFFLTQFALFWFAWAYRGRKGHKAIYWSHNEQLEMVWMIVPAVVMTFLVVQGLQAWNTIMADEGEHEIEIEATGYQFAWEIRYGGRDNMLGTKDFRKIGGKNSLGQDWTDEKNVDDVVAGDIYLPVGKKIRVRITAKDVLHNFYLPQFRVKMDAVPGMPTYFNFTPTVTTDSMRRRLSASPEWQVADKNDDSKKRWEAFDYELACAELCGKGHYSMRRVVKIVSQEVYEEWLDKQESNSAYMTMIRSLSDAERAEAKRQGAPAHQYTDPFAAIAKGELLFEKLVALKNKVNVQVKSLTDALAAAKKAKNIAEITKVEAALIAIQAQQKIARFSNNLEEANTAEREANRIASQVMQANNTITTDSTLIDSTAIPVDTTAKKIQ